MKRGSRTWVWCWRLVVGAVLVAGVLAFGTAFDVDPDPVATALLLLLLIALAGLLVDSAVSLPPPWGALDGRDTDVRGRDGRTAGNLRLLESHVSSRHADSGLRDRLRSLAEEELRAHHDVGLDGPLAHDLLGPQVMAVLTGPPRRLKTDEIDSCVTRIERIAP